MPYNIILYVNIIMPKLLKPSRVPKRNIGKKVKKRKRVFRKKKDPQISQKVSIKIDLGKQMKEAKGYEIPSRGRVTFDPLPPPQAFQVEKREAFEFPKQKQLTIEDIREELKKQPQPLKQIEEKPEQHFHFPSVPIAEPKEPIIEEIEEPIISRKTGKPMRYTKKGRPFMSDLTHEEQLQEIRDRAELGLPI